MVERTPNQVGTKDDPAVNWQPLYVWVTLGVLPKARGYLSKPSFPSLIPSLIDSPKQNSIFVRISHSLSKNKHLPRCASPSSPQSLHSALQLLPKVFLIRSPNVLKRASVATWARAVLPTLHAFALARPSTPCLAVCLIPARRRILLQLLSSPSSCASSRMSMSTPNPRAHLAARNRLAAQPLLQATLPPHPRLAAPP